jgi:Flp pilus assembly protein TadB
MHTVTAALLLAAAGLGLLGPGRTSSRFRLRAESGGPSTSGRQSRGGAWSPGSGPIDRAALAGAESRAQAIPALAGVRSAVVRLGSALAGWLTVAMLLGGWSGVVLGGVAGVCVERVLHRMEPVAMARRRARRAAELPVALDLLAVCLRAGTPLVTAFDAVASALPDALADDLRRVAALQRLGATAAAAWADHATDPVLRPVAEAVARSAESGSRLADSFERLAAECRVELAIDGEARARRAGVLAMAPLGLCFLPAFVCLGVIPLVLSITTTVFGSVR